MHGRKKQRGNAAIYIFNVWECFLQRSLSFFEKNIWPSRLVLQTWAKKNDSISEGVQICYFIIFWDIIKMLYSCLVMLLTHYDTWTKLTDEYFHDTPSDANTSSVFDKVENKEVKRTKWWYEWLLSVCWWYSCWLMYWYLLCPFLCVCHPCLNISRVITSQVVSFQVWFHLVLMCVCARISLFPAVCK